MHPTIKMPVSCRPLTSIKDLVISEVVYSQECHVPVSLYPVKLILVVDPGNRTYCPFRVLSSPLMTCMTTELESSRLPSVGLNVCRTQPMSDFSHLLEKLAAIHWGGCAGISKLFPPAPSPAVSLNVIWRPVKQAERD